jgi:hypothetical protein
LAAVLLLEEAPGRGGAGAGRLHFEPLAEAEAARLEELILATLEWRIGAGLDLGRHTPAGA